MGGWMGGIDLVAVSHRAGCNAEREYGMVSYAFGSVRQPEPQWGRRQRPGSNRGIKLRTSEHVELPPSKIISCECGAIDLVRITGRGL